MRLPLLIMTLAAIVAAGEDWNEKLKQAAALRSQSRFDEAVKLYRELVEESDRFDTFDPRRAIVRGDLGFQSNAQTGVGASRERCGDEGSSKNELFHSGPP